MTMRPRILAVRPVAVSAVASSVPVLNQQIGCKERPKMSYFVSSGSRHLNAINQSVQWLWKAYKLHRREPLSCSDSAARASWRACPFPTRRCRDPSRTGWWTQLANWRHARTRTARTAELVTIATATETSPTAATTSPGTDCFSSAALRIAVDVEFNVALTASKRSRLVDTMQRIHFYVVTIPTLRSIRQFSYIQCRETDCVTRYKPCCQIWYEWFVLIFWSAPYNTNKVYRYVCCANIDVARFVCSLYTSSCWRVPFLAVWRMQCNVRYAPASH